jgi:hypothetical protein
MLKFYEYFSQIPIPEFIKDTTFTTNKDGSIIPMQGLDAVSKVNIFVGPNNSGKSRLLRKLLIYQADSRLNLLEKLFLEKISLIAKPFTQDQVIRSPSGGFYFSIDAVNTIDSATIIGWFDSLGKSLSKRNYTEINETLYFGFNLFKLLSDKSSLYTIKNTILREDVGEYSNKNIFEYFGPLVSELTKLVDNLEGHLKKIHKIYVPNVRTLKNYSENKRSLIYSDIEKNEDEKEFKSLISEDTKSKYFAVDSEITINDGQSFYLDLFEKRNSSNENLEKLKKYQRFLSKSFFDGEDLSIISDVTNHQVKIQIGGEEDRIIHDLGDGVQQMIMLTFPLFFNDYGMMVIEEPEMWVHPGLQKTIMEIFTSDELADEYGYSKNFIYFIATHSNHILDFQKNHDEISIFSVEKKQDQPEPDLIINSLANKDTKILDLIGVSNSSVYLANCAIWVEGSTDKLYLGKYLDETIKHYTVVPDKEDILHEKLKKFNLIEGTHYTFAFSAGNSIFNLDFSDSEEYDKPQKEIIVRYLTNKAMVIADNDGDKNQELKKALKEHLTEDNFIELPVNEIENLLDETTIANAVKSTWKNNLKDTIELSAKIVNFDKNLKLGKALDKKLKRSLPEMGFGITSFAEKSGTIKSKSKFCNNAIEFIEWGNMTEESKEVARNILEFIFKSNNL